MGSRSIRHSSGCSVFARLEFQGWNSTVDICTAQITLAVSVTHNSSAKRPDGKLTCAVCTQSGAPFGSRFW